MIVSSYMRDYEVEFFHDFSFIDRLKEIENTYYVVDRKITELYPDKFNELIKGRSFVFEAIEENKTLDTALEIIDELVKLKTKRNTRLVAIGGGIVQDIVAFVSTVIYRGIDWYLVPTTLLSQTDSCIGSKSSINYKSNKNLIGTFYPPTKIFVCSEFLKSLSDRDYFSGLGEIVKCSIMAGRKSFEVTKERLPSILDRDYTLLMKEIEKTLAFKKAVIEQDEFDKDYRNIMNYGHTFGHAIESATKYGVPHGQAVALGILIANSVSLERRLIDREYNDSIAEVIRKILSPYDYPSIDPENVISFMRNDKKYDGKYHNCILLTGDCVKKFRDVTDAESVAAIKKGLSNTH